MRNKIIILLQSVIAVRLMIGYNDNKEMYHAADVFTGVVLLHWDCRSPLPAEIPVQNTKNILGNRNEKQTEIFSGFCRSRNHPEHNAAAARHSRRMHKKLVEELNLKSVNYFSSELKGLADSENPLDPVNRIHCLLKMLLNAHSGFCRDEIQDYLNLYSFVINPPSDHLEKVEKIINLVFENLKSLK